jgi:hypothetical protein
MIQNKKKKLGSKKAVPGQRTSDFTTGIHSRAQLASSSSIYPTFNKLSLSQGAKVGNRKPSGTRLSFVTHGKFYLAPFHSAEKIDIQNTLLSAILVDPIHCQLQYLD